MVSRPYTALLIAVLVLWSGFVGFVGVSRAAALALGPCEPGYVWRGSPGITFVRVATPPSNRRPAGMAGSFQLSHDVASRSARAH